MSAVPRIIPAPGTGPLDYRASTVCDAATYSTTTTARNVTGGTMATREQILNDQHDTTKGLSMQERADIRTMAHHIKSAIREEANRLNTNDPRIAFTALLNVVADLIATFFVEDEAEMVRRMETLMPMYVAAYRQKEKKI